MVWKDASPGKEMMYDHFASPLVVESAGKGQVIHPQADGWVRSFDAATGKLIWKFDTNAKHSPLDFIAPPTKASATRSWRCRCVRAGASTSPQDSPLKPAPAPANSSASIPRKRAM